MRPISIYDGVTRKRLCFLHLAHKISYTRERNSVWIASFTIPFSDAKKKFCVPTNLVEIWDVGYHGEDIQVGLFRIMPTATVINDTERTITFQLEHVLAVLADDIMLGWHEIGNTEVTTDKVIIDVLSNQTVANWKFVGSDYKYSFLYGWQDENILTGLFSITTPFIDTDYTWVYNTNVYPWEISLKKVTATPVADVRYHKNLIGMTRDEDVSQLVTVLYPYGFGENDNRLDIKSVNGGKDYLTASTVSKYGTIKRIWHVPEYEDAQQLFDAAKAMLEALKNPIVKYTFEIGFVNTTAYVDPGDMIRVIDPADGLDHRLRVLSIAKNDVGNAPRTGTITVANENEDLAQATADFAERNRINTTYAHGSESIFADSLYDNADPENPAELHFTLPTNTIHVNEILLDAALTQFRAYSKASADGGSTVRTTTANGADTRTSSDGGASTRTSSAGGKSTRTSSAGGASTQTASDGGEHISTTSAGGAYVNSTGNGGASVQTSSAGGAYVSTVGSGGGISNSTSAGGAFVDSTGSGGDSTETSTSGGGGNVTSMGGGSTAFTVFSPSGDYPTTGPKNSISPLTGVSAANVRVDSAISTVSSGGGGSISGGGGSISGGGSTASANVSLSGGGGSTGGSSVSLSGGSHSHSASASGSATSYGSLNIYVTVGSSYGLSMSGGNHSHSMGSHSHSGGSHTHMANHSHSLPAHNHSLPNHTHSASSHIHTVNDSRHSHTTTMPNHMHGFNLGHSHDIRIQSHSHTVQMSGHQHSVKIPSHKHGVNIPNHNHSVNIPNHNHGVNIPTHTHNVNIPNHNHSVNIPNHKHDINIPNHNHKINIPNHTHTVEIPDHTHTTTIPAHNHKVDIANHTHQVTLEDHTHAIVYGIYKGTRGTAMQVFIDDKLIGSYGTSARGINLVANMQKNANGDVLRGKHVIRIVPDRLTRVECSVIIRLFTNARGGVTA